MNWEESNWVQMELMRAAWQVESIQENAAGEVPVGLLPGTLDDWYVYRGKLKKWNETHPGYPDITQRPQAPTGVDNGSEGIEAG